MAYDSRAASEAAEPAAVDGPRARSKVRRLATSKIRDVANSGLDRQDVLRFWFGESDQPTGEAIVAAAQAALAQGRTFYVHNLGMPELRRSLSHYLQNLHGRTIGEDAIAVTSSGVSALMIAMQAVLDPGDQVVVVAPVWPNIAAIPAILGAELVRIPLRPEGGRWRLDLDRLLDAIGPTTRLVLVNSPGNPTGWTLASDQLGPIIERCRRFGAWLIADDVYERLVFGPAARAPSLLSVAEPQDRLISTNSFSKTWSMTGWRLGWIAAPPALRDDLGKLIEYNTSCAPEFVQRAGLAALAAGDEPIEAFRGSLAARRDRLLARLGRLQRLEATTPDGAMYAMIRIPGFEDSVRLARRLVQEAGLGLAPGAAFGPEGEGWLRWCFAVAPDALDAGVARLEGWLATGPVAP